MRKQLLNSIGLGTALVLSGCSGKIKQKKDEVPNILFLFTDDQRFNTISSLGNDEILTPNIDRLVQSGLSFTHAHIMGGTSGAVSMPSRAMLLTGKSIFHLENKGARIPEDHIMMPEYFKNAGYTTFGTGKWHNGKDSYARCFTHGGNIMFHGMSNHLKVPVYDFDSTGQYPKENEYIATGFSSEIFADEVIDFISDKTNDSPFFAYVAFSAPHDPRMAPQLFEDKYPEENISLPENFLPEHPFDNGEMKIRDEKLAPWPRTPEIVKEHLAAYYAMVTHTDFQIGKIIDALEKSGKAKNTIIVFAGDNGLAVGNHGLMGKQNVYEHSIRVPLIIGGPGIPENRKTDALVYLNDIFPSLCELLKMEIPSGVESKSFLPIIKDDKAKIRDELFYIYRNYQRAVRTSDNWKLIKYNVNQKEYTQLFDLNIDSIEMNNLAGRDEFKTKEEELLQLMVNLMKKYDDPVDFDLKNWKQPIIVHPERNVEHKAVGKDVVLGTLYSTKYTAGGKKGLTDGKRGLLDFTDEAWQGYHQVDFQAIVDMGTQIDISEITVGFLENIGSWIFLPLHIEFAISTDGENFQPVGEHQSDEAKEKERNEVFNFKSKFDRKTARYIRVIAKNRGVCPTWH
ncbi:sulfatase-like hydrolase/transferase, partial [Bacteroidota bacterium]